MRFFKGTKRQNLGGFSYINLLTSAAVFGVLCWFVLGGVPMIANEIRATSLRSEVKTVNFAIDIFLSRGGTLGGITDPNAIIETVRGHTSVADGLTPFPSSTNAMIDPQLTAELQTQLEAKTNEPRAVWNRLEKRFEITTTGTGVRKFVRTTGSKGL